MKKLIVAAVALVGLGGCVAVPAPYPSEAYYYPAPVVGFGFYGGHGHHGHHHRHHHRRHHWR